MNHPCRRPSVVVATVFAILSLAVPTACSSGGDKSPTVELRVAAAASLTESFTTIGTAFEAAHPGVKVVFDFGPSSGLADSLIEGSPSDVFASADEKNMKKLIAAAVVSAKASRGFAKNRGEIAVPARNPGNVVGLADFARRSLLVGLCAAEVPCGKVARAVLHNAGVVPSIDTNEADVKSLLTKIEVGELDVGIVYRTDVVAAGERVKGIVIPDRQNVIASYPIAVIDRAGSGQVGAQAKAFVDFVASSAGQQILAAAGFLKP